MTDAEATVAVIDALESLTVPYMLVGSFSSSFYGVSRLTRDADLVLHLDAMSLAELGNRLGPRFRVDPQMAFESITLTTRYVVEVVGSSFRIEIFRLTDDPHDQERFRRRRQ